MFAHYCEGADGEAMFPDAEMKPGCAWSLVVRVIGARATVDMKDFTATNLRGKALRFLSADRRLLDSTGAVRIEAIPAVSQEDRQLREFAAACEWAAQESRRVDFQSLLGLPLAELERHGGPPV